MHMTLTATNTVRPDQLDRSQLFWAIHSHLVLMSSFVGAVDYIGSWGPGRV